MLGAVKAFGRDERGATAIEYTMLAAFIALAIVIVLPLIGSNLSERFQAVVDAFGN